MKSKRGLMNVSIVWLQLLDLCKLSRTWYKIILFKKPQYLIWTSGKLWLFIAVSHLIWHLCFSWIFCHPMSINTLNSFCQARFILSGRLESYNTYKTTRRKSGPMSYTITIKKKKSVFIRIYHLRNYSRPPSFHPSACFGKEAGFPLSL